MAGLYEAVGSDDRSMRATSDSNVAAVSKVWRSALKAVISAAIIGLISSSLLHLNEDHSSDVARCQRILGALPPQRTSEGDASNISNHKGHVLPPQSVITRTLDIAHDEVEADEIAVATIKHKHRKEACREAKHRMLPFCNTSLPLEERIDDLLARLDRSDKPRLLTARLNHALPKLGVPGFHWGTNCLHGIKAQCSSKKKCPTEFGSGANLAATFDKSLASEEGNIMGRELRALYNDDNQVIGLVCWGLSINLVRDPRWGRNADSGSEDPHLLGEMVAAWTRGFQQGRNAEETGRYLQAVATLKHFVANSLDNAIIDGRTYSRNSFDAKISKGQLQESYFPAFRRGVEEGARGLMCSYNAVNGIPTCLDANLKAARELWAGRKPWGGYVVSDSDSVADAARSHHYAKSNEEAACLAVKDGGDDINSGKTYLNHLLAGVDKGHCSLRDVDMAVRNALRIRFELGLFDPPELQPLTQLGSDDIDTLEAQAVNKLHAGESIVLLKNDGILPLKKGMRVAVVGPHANATRFLFPVATGRMCSGSGTFDCVESPFSAIRRANIGGETKLAVGCDLIDSSISTKQLLNKALEIARDADVVVIGLGIAQCGGDKHADSYMGGLLNNPQGLATSVVPPYRTWGNCWGHKQGSEGREIGAEAHDRMSIDLPKVQRNFAQEIFKLGKPTVVFFLQGASVDYGIELHRTNAAVTAFYPGMKGARALAEALFGDSNKWGRMPFTTYPASFVKEASFLEHDLSKPPGRTHKYYQGHPVVRFGFGLSYTQFILIRVPERRASTFIPLDTGSDVNTSIHLNVKNVGNMSGDVVLMAYWRTSTPLKVQPQLRQKLFWFEREHGVGKGANRMLSIPLSCASFAVADEKSGDLVVYPETYSVEVTDGSGRPEGTLQLDVRVKGKPIVLEKFPQSHDYLGNE